MNEKLTELAKRCEAATVPDRELDADMALTQGWTEHPGDNWIGPHGEICVPEFTASLDAALKLVPKGHDIKIIQASGHGRSDWYGNCKLRNDWGDAICHRGNAASGALALCAAALRAHAAFNATETG